MSLINLLTFATLMVLAVEIATAMPLSRSIKKRSFLHLPIVFYSIHTGFFVSGSENGSVSALHWTLQDKSTHFWPTKVADNKYIIQSAKFNGHVLHFAQGNGSSNTSEFDTSTVVLRLGEASGGVAHHWTRDISQGPDLLFHNHGHDLFSVTLEDGKTCYLAFERDGTPVEDPCVDKDELLTKALFFLPQPPPA